MRSKRGQEKVGRLRENSAPQNHGARPHFSTNSLRKRSHIAASVGAAEDRPLSNDSSCSMQPRYTLRSLALPGSVNRFGFAAAIAKTKPSRIAGTSKSHSHHPPLFFAGTGPA